MSDETDELTGLIALLERGLLTKEEFAQEEARILAESAPPEVAEPEDPIQTSPMVLLPTSGDTLHEDGFEKIVTPREDRETAPVLVPPAPSESVASGFGKGLIWVLGLGLFGGLSYLALMAFEDDFDSIFVSKKHSRDKDDDDDDEREKLVYPADICEMDWELSKGEPYKADRKDIGGSIEMSDCMDRNEEREERVSEKAWESFAVCMRSAASTYEALDCKDNVDGSGRSKRKRR
jgi:hypothetical protein